MELMFRSVVSWYKMSFMVYFEFWLRRRGARLGVELRLGRGPYS